MQVIIKPTKVSIHVKLESFSVVLIFWLHNNIRDFQLSIDSYIYNAKHEENQ